ncbi:hypothetical protein CONPUDRAFT_137947 [Coniophora puteana RWD-64-598 SS2]|uniref:tRNA(Ile)-lysidine synthetase n=1 Tax=Coniophora puteana (strain RWD-64-598) TaxID=741705 RepID=A0A5M3MKS1_CONPW|nr:uncharacterized protein CONPUDRAFT_137947 [Coniophora puteana RWD-64-598 SS2]EIW79666.1 hypothetical protein CONPUDRAFT_137947 [Coniophora puteana RWD-64-598 SS2]
MAERAATNAAHLGVPHRTLRIPWGEAPYPRMPSPGQRIENIAREARYRLMFDEMTNHGSTVLAMAHHGDDQVETGLMRLARGTTKLGEGGMRPVRRWGMGGDTKNGRLAFVGAEGMRRWMSRPLLEVRKDRILATCEANGLEYIDDPTNFQPSICLRNAIRHLMHNNGQMGDVELPKDIQDQLAKVEGVIDMSGGVEHIRSRIREASMTVSDVNEQVSAVLASAILPSPPGTLLLSCNGLGAVQDPLVRHSIALRVLRYASFQPWGSIRSDANRRQDSINRLVTALWAPWPSNLSKGRATSSSSFRNSPPLRSKSMPPPMDTSARTFPQSKTSQETQLDSIPDAFSVGSGVFWRRAVLRPHGYLLLGAIAARRALDSKDTTAWLATRLPAYRGHDVTLIAEELNHALQGSLKAEGKENIEVLWDCRFAVRFNLARIPLHVRKAVKDGASVAIAPGGKCYYLPSVVLLRDGYEGARVEQYDLPIPERLATLTESGRIDHKKGDNAWVEFEFVRLLSDT